MAKSPRRMGEPGVQREQHTVREHTQHTWATQQTIVIVMAAARNRRQWLVRRDVKHVVGGTEANLRTQVQILSLSKPGN